MATSSARWIFERDSTEMSYGMHVWQCSMQLISNKLLGAQNVYNGLGQDRVDGDKLNHTPKCQGGSLLDQICSQRCGVISPQMEGESDSKSKHA